MIFGIEKWQDDCPAFISEDGSITDYGTVRELCASIGHALTGRSLIFCLCRNSIASVCGYLGIIESGSCVLLLGGKIDREQLEKLTELYRPSYFWRPVSDEMPREPVYAAEGYGLYATGLESPALHPDLALLLSTSGSTGSPKLIRLSRTNLESNAAQIAEYLELGQSERPITMLPMQYTFGLSVINSHLHAGACTLLTDKSIVQQEFWDFRRKYGGTSLSGVPYTYEILHRIHFMQRDDIDGITSMIQAGGHLPVELQESFGKWAQERGIRFYVMYGQTEATARMSYLPWQKCLEKIGTIGIAVPGGRFELRDAYDNVIDESEVTGELVFYGPNVSLGYATGPDDLKSPDDNKGMLRTGDMAMRDRDGYYVIKGRKNRFVKLYGIRVGLDECENILKGLDEDALFACEGTDDRLVIFTDSPKYKEADAYLAERIGINARAFESRYIAKIPVKDTGKTDHGKLKEMLNARPPYRMEKTEKDAFLTEELKKLTSYHMENCPKYARILKAQGIDLEKTGDFRELPFLPAGLFKRLRLSSLQGEDDKGARVLTSSGTKSQMVSQIILDGETRTAQQRALAEIGTDFLGPDRLPMLVIDCQSTVTNRERFSARTAGIQGFSLFGHHRTFALKEDMSPDEDA